MLFLFVGGVLNDDSMTELVNDTKYVGVDKKYLKLLKTIKCKTDCQIVLCGSWRFSKECKKYLSEKMKKYSLRYVSETPIVDTAEEIDIAKEIDQWFKNNNDITIESYVILSQIRYEEFSKYDMDDHVVVTTNGLTNGQVEKAIEILNGE